MAKKKRATEKPEPKGWISKTGRKPIMPGFLPEEHESIRNAAHLEKKSMTQFVHDAALAAADKVISRKSQQNL